MRSLQVRNIGAGMARGTAMVTVVVVIIIEAIAVIMGIAMATTVGTMATATDRTIVRTTCRTITDRMSIDRTTVSRFTVTVARSACGGRREQPRSRPAVARCRGGFFMRKTLLRESTFTINTSTKR